MNHDRWNEIRQKISSSFTILDEYDEDLDPGSAEVIEFEGPMGTMRASFITRPKTLGKKTLYSNRAGGDVAVDIEFSDTETVNHLEVHKLSGDGETWEEIDASVL